MRIIGIAGYARSGKDTLGSLLVNLHGYERRSFAAALKDVLYATNPLAEIGEEQGGGSKNTTSVRHLVDFYGWDEAKELSPGFYGVRGLLQRLGTEGGREVLGQNVWVDAAMSTLTDPDGKYVFTDMRFPNEYHAIDEAGGLVVRISRQSAALVNPHVSETALDGVSFDRLIHNDGTIDDLREIARSIA